jgi:excisionase family DNA binding protein
MTAMLTTWTLMNGGEVRVPAATEPPVQARQLAPPAVPRLLTVKDAAERCQLSESAIRRAIRDGELPASMLRSRLRIKEADLDAWIASKRCLGAVPARARATGPRTSRQAPAGTFRALANASDDADRL